MMSEMATDLGSIAGHAWLIFAAVLAWALLVCVTSIILVYSVDRRDRVKAISALAPLLSLANPARSLRTERGIERPTASRRRAKADHHG
jgi:hypothetical protein